MRTSSDGISRQRGASVAVIGAGSSGLAAARHGLALGFDVHVFEREDDLGGNWNFGKPNARVYRSTHTISSKPGTEYTDYPMPDSFPDYPHHTQILSYLRAYADHFGVTPHIRFDTPVEKVEPTDRKSTRLNSSHIPLSRMPSSA